MPKLTFTKEYQRRLTKIQDSLYEYWGDDKSFSSLKSKLDTYFDRVASSAQSFPRLSHNVHWFLLEHHSVQFAVTYIEDRNDVRVLGIFHTKSNWKRGYL